MFDSALELALRRYSVLPLQVAKLPGMPVVDCDRRSVSREAQAGEQRASYAASAKEYDTLHESRARAWSAAATSASTSFSVCAVEIIQCKPFEGVM